MSWYKNHSTQKKQCLWEVRGDQGASEDISERNERFHFKLPRILELKRPHLAVQLPTKNRNSFVIAFSTALVVKVSRMILMFYVVNTLPGGGAALRFETADSGQCIHLNSDTKFLRPKPDFPREKSEPSGLRFTQCLLLARSH